MRFRIVLTQRQSTVVAFERIVKTVQSKLSIAAIIEHIGMIWPQHKRAIIGRERQLVLSLRGLNHSENVGCIEMVRRTGNNLLTNLLRFTQLPGLVRRNRTIKSDGRVERGARHCALSTLTKRLDRQLASQLVKLREQFGWKRQPVADSIGTPLRALLAGQSHGFPG